MPAKYSKEKFSGHEYKYFGTINGFEVFINASWPDTTEQKIAEFLQEQGRPWMLEHIGHNPEKHFRRAEATIDSHFYILEHPTEGNNRKNRVLVDRN